jgi:hypothetical protein
MNAPLKTAVLAAVRRLLEPLARLLLEAGVGVGEMQALVKAAYVRAATEPTGENSRPDVSRIAVRTGLTRPEVARLLAEPDSGPLETDYGRHRAERVLAGWWTDPDFQDKNGQPRILPLEGPSRSFAELVRRYSGDPQRVSTILAELLRVKAVRRGAQGRLEPLSRTFSNARWDTEAIAAAGERLRDHIETVVHNLKHPSRPLYQRVIVNPAVDPSYIPMLVRDLTSQTDAVADGLEDALNNPAARVLPGEEPKDAVRLGLAFYLFEEPRVIERTPSKPPRRRPE